jgi:hypothetical protein
MRKNDITLREFIYAYATTQGSSGYGERPATRAKRLVEAIYGQLEVLDALRQHPASSAAGIVTVKALRKEMKALEEAGEMFGGYKVNSDQDSPTDAKEDQVALTRDGVSVEDYEAVLGDMQFEQMFREVETRAPMLFGLLIGLMAPKVVRKDQGPRNPTKFNNRLAVITSILCYSWASEGSNKFPCVFGAFLQSNGVKRRVLDLLHQFGLSKGYKGVHKHLETVAQ